MPDRSVTSDKCAWDELWHLFCMPDHVQDPRNQDRENDLELMLKREPYGHKLVASLWRKSRTYRNAGGGQ
jgi:hypothetical protein